MERKSCLESEMQRIMDEETTSYQNTTRKSENLYNEAKKYLPGGITRVQHFFEPYPLYIERGEGCYIIDVDGNSRIDFFNNATSLILGHCHPSVVKAVSEQILKGTAFHGPTSQTTELAKLICERIPSVEKIRFTNSGSEATLLAIQLMKAFTGKNKVAKFEGGYHGFHEYASISVKPPVELAGDADEPKSVPDGLGVSEDILKNVVVLPYNNIDAVEKIVKKHKGDLAGIIVEPMMGSAGAISGRKQFLWDLRQLTSDNNLVLIMDEVQTFRFSMGGAQALYNIMPDLTTLGKIIGGGFPVGAVGGRDDIMSLLDSTSGKPKIRHAGTFNGNPITMVAGLATLKELTPMVFKKLSDLCNALRVGLREIFERYSIPAQVTGNT